MCYLVADPEKCCVEQLRYAIKRLMFFASGEIIARIYHKSITTFYMRVDSAQTHLFHHMFAISSSVRGGMRRLGTGCIAVKRFPSIGGAEEGVSGAGGSCLTKGNDS